MVSLSIRIPVHEEVESHLFERTPSVVESESPEWHSAIYDVWMDNGKEHRIYRDLLTTLKRLEQDVKGFQISPDVFAKKRDVLVSGILMLARSTFFLHNKGLEQELLSRASLLIRVTHARNSSQ
jgi:hypothetical protein